MFQQDQIANIFDYFRIFNVNSVWLYRFSVFLSVAHNQYSEKVVDSNERIGSSLEFFLSLMFRGNKRIPINIIELEENQLVATNVITTNLRYVGSLQLMSCLVYQ